MPKQEECKYSKSHEWIHVEGDIATCGLSQYAQQEVGDIVFIELPKAGDKLEKGKQCAVIESVKAASDFYSPLSGEVTEVNEKLTDDPALVNKSANDEGWLFKLKISNPDEVNDCMDFSAYNEFIKTEGK